ncbi:hypothetical protein V5799_027433 [Amblyomma americanum]|uniref:Uncharacterized protein n=1 Tax=Amblyomma americanum TaxID=6943 RepID=A0AAQ4DFR0_AMBAM
MAAEEPLLLGEPAFLARAGAPALVGGTAVNDLALKLASAAVTWLDSCGSLNLGSSVSPAGVKDGCLTQRSSISCRDEPFYAPVDSGLRGSDDRWTGALGGTA